MKVLFVTTSYPEDEKDWQAHFIRSLIWALADRELIQLSLWGPKGTLPDKVRFSVDIQDQQFLHELRKSGGIAHQLRTGFLRALNDVLRLLSRLRKLYRNSSEDVIHINWLQNAIPMIGSQKPIVVSVLGSDYKLLDIPFMPWLLRLAFKGKTVLLTPNAGWMVPRLEKLFGDIATIKCIRFGVDERLFSMSRHAKLEPPVWLVVSRLTTAKVGHLFDWGRTAFSQYRKLVLLGPNQEDMQLPDWLEYHGTTNPEDMLRKWFPKVTGVISLSTHSEGCPQVLLDAMAAGLPVIATGIDGHLDAIRHEENGFIVDSEQEFIDALKRLEDKQRNNRMSKTARKFIQAERGSWQKTAEAYKDAYEYVVEKNASN